MSVLTPATTEQIARDRIVERLVRQSTMLWVIMEDVYYVPKADEQPARGRVHESMHAVCWCETKEEAERQLVLCRKSEPRGERVRVFSLHEVHHVVQGGAQGAMELCERLGGEYLNRAELVRKAMGDPEVRT